MTAVSSTVEMVVVVEESLIVELLRMFGRLDLTYKATMHARRRRRMSLSVISIIE